MALTQAQNTLIKAAILADPVLAAIPNDFDGAYAVAEALNQLASPTFTVWRTAVELNEVGRAMNSSEIGGLTTANASRLQVIGIYLRDGGVNPSLASNRAFFDDIFSGAGGVNTRASLLALWKRPARRIEKILATGTGTDAVPATLSFEGAISYQDVYEARR